VKRLLSLAYVRFYLRHPWQLALAIAGISLGVGVYVGVDVASDNAARAFDLSSALVRGQTTHRLLPIGAEIDESVYRQLVVERGLALAAPVIELDVTIGGHPGVRFPLLGIDLLQPREMRAFAGFAPKPGWDLVRLVTEPRTVLIAADIAAELGVTEGSRIGIDVRGREISVEVVGMLEGEPASADSQPPIVSDIATAQEIAGMVGTLSRIDLELTQSEAQQLALDPPRGTALTTARDEDLAFEELAGAFRTNLTALGLLALVVGVFLIYGTMTFAVVQRRTTLGVLRALGLRRSEIIGSVLCEALTIGVVASIVGLLIGHVLATTLVDLVLRTIGDLYFSAAVKEAPLSLMTYARGAVLGIVGTILAGVKPALDAARAAPAAVLRRAELERGAHRGARSAARAALPMLVASLLLLAWGPRDLYTAFAGLFGVIAACALCVPAAVLLFTRALEIGGRPWLALPAVLALRGVGASLSRTGVAAVALAIAVATVNGVGVMIGSFRASLDEWLGDTLTADIYASFDGDGVALSDDQITSIERAGGVRGISLTRAALVPTSAGQILVRATRPGPRGWGLDIVVDDEKRALDELASGRGTVISERLSMARNLRVGDTIAIPTPSGVEPLPIVGVFRDFNTGAYSIVLSLDWFRERWRDLAVTGIGVFLDPGVTPADVEPTLRAALPTPVRIRTTDSIRRISLQIFDRTFQITEVLRLLAGIVAFLGVLSALLSIELERTRELAVLRAIGFRPRELTATLLTQTGLLGAAAGLAAAPIGIALAALLVHVINRRSFGWSMDLIVTPGPIASGFVLAVGAALLAGIYPAVRAVRSELAGALRDE
jgi:putative ABC transport system permease protein